VHHAESLSPSDPEQCAVLTGGETVIEAAR
jgi:hypothetical protein